MLGGGQCSSLFHHFIIWRKKKSLCKKQLPGSLYYTVHIDYSQKLVIQYFLMPIKYYPKSCKPTYLKTFFIDIQSCEQHCGS